MTQPSHSLPLLALRDVVVCPHMQIALFVGRAQSIAAVERAQLHGNGTVFVVAQKEALSESISIDNLYEYGLVCQIVEVLDTEHDEENCIKVLIEGKTRAKLSNMVDLGSKGLEAHIVDAPINEDLTAKQQRHELDALQHNFAHYATSKLRNSSEVIAASKHITDLQELVYFVVTRAPMSIEQKQAYLNSQVLSEQVDLLQKYLFNSSQEQEIDANISDAVKKAMEKNQREYYLNEKMKVIQKELTGLNGSGDDDMVNLENRLKEAKLPADAQKKADAELRKLKAMPASSSEATVVRGYLEWIANTPWSKSSKIKSDIGKAEAVLNADHYGLEDVKERILEYLAVQARVKALKGPILCLVGPPGVGKTSLGESIAKATGREFVRMALGGVRDEAEIRGHRRTYIGAMPGKIVQSLAKVEVNNPLFLLDEIDKMANDSRGDPASALLEVLDPAQNHKFNDHYLDLDLDLSKVMFVCTANSMNIPAALLDRMEIINLAGYTEDEKSKIAEQYLVPRAIKNNGLHDNELRIDDEAIRDLIRRYTREAGVRNLEREIQKICRKVVKNSLSSPTVKPSAKSQKFNGIQLTLNNLADYSGVYKYDFGRANQAPQVGRINGLGWSPVGGDLLVIEVATMKGKGNLNITGLIREVMQESMKMAWSVVKVNSQRLGIEHTKLEQSDIHIHVPAGGTPKDGPSAGIALTTAITSALTGIAVKPDIAMTGEVSLLGQVLPIGGLKEKLLAAHRGGIKLVLIPEDNMRELDKVPAEIMKDMEVRGVKHIDEVLEIALVDKLTPYIAPPMSPTAATGSSVPS